MLRHTSLCLAIALCPLAALSQSATPLVGTWSGTTKGQGGGELSVLLTVTPSGGTWSFVRQGSKGKNNPCLGKEFPVEVTSHTADTLVIHVHGDQVLQGCINTTATLRPADGNTLQGTLADGRPVTLARQ